MGELCYRMSVGGVLVMVLYVAVICVRAYSYCVVVDLLCSCCLAFCHFIRGVW